MALQDQNEGDEHLWQKIREDLAVRFARVRAEGVAAERAARKQDEDQKIFEHGRTEIRRRGAEQA